MQEKQAKNCIKAVYLQKIPLVFWKNSLEINEFMSW